MARDIEESPEELESGELTDYEKRSTRERWEQGQRDLVTTVIDYTLSTIMELVHDDYIELSPTYQRRDRWDDVRKSRLIESFLLNIPIPPIFLNEDEYGTYSIIDGKQRVKAVVDYLDDKYPLKHLDAFYEAEGRRFSQLPIQLQRVLKTRASLRATIILHVSDPQLKYDVFDRLNTGGVQLNAQEVRNNSFRGSLNDLIMELSEYPPFHSALGIRNKESSSIWREMRDAELVLRYLAFSRDQWRYGGSVVVALNEFMASNYRVSQTDLDDMRASFTSSLEKCVLVFGETLFRRWIPRTEKPRQQVLAAIYDAQMLAVRNFAVDKLREHSAEIELGMKELFKNEDFQQSISAQTNTPRFFWQRVDQVQYMIESAVRQK